MLQHEKYIFFYSTLSDCLSYNGITETGFPETEPCSSDAKELTVVA